MDKKENGLATKNVMVNVTVNVDPDVLSKVMVDVLSNGEVVRGLGSEGLQAILDKINSK